MRATLLFSAHKDGVYLSVRARPGAAKKRAPRLVETGDGQRAVEISVSAAPEDGKANRALCEEIARALGLRKNAVAVKAGQTGRLKLIAISGAPEELAPKIEAWLASL